MGKLSDDERDAIMAESRATLDRLADLKVTEPTREEILQEAMALPCESYVDRSPNANYESAMKGAERGRQRETAESDAATTFEVRLMARIEGQANGQRDVALELIADALDVYDAEVSGPMAREIAALRQQVTALEAQCKKLELDRATEPITLPALPLRRADHHQKTLRHDRQNNPGGDPRLQSRA